nr:metal-dependent hydrolase [uncultured Rhodoferax sp.]
MNGPTHRLVAGASIAAAAIYHEQRSGEEPTAMPLAAGTFGALCTNLPDILEPATSPNHRKTFHSVTCAAVIAIGMKKAWDWTPEDDFGRFARFVLLVAGAGYLTHLALDATTKRSLPLI